MRQILTTLSLFAALACQAAAAPRDSPLEGAFNSWAIQSLKRARAEWKKDACLGTAIVWLRPGHKDLPEGYLAGGEIYEFYLYSPSDAGAYHFLSPFQPAERGRVSSFDAREHTGPGSIGNAPRCIAKMPISVAAALASARKAGFTDAPDKVYRVQRDLFYRADFVHGPTGVFREYGRAAVLWNNGIFDEIPGDGGLSRVPREREIWLLAAYDAGIPMTLVSLAAVDALNGRVLKVIRRP